MAAQALYRRWRPQSFDDVLGQDHIIQTLRNAVAGDRLAHAYLFTGPRGTGKTSVARILAKAVNCTGAGDRKPCNACPTCVAMTEGRSMDLIEIDAASNTGVDDVRDLRDKIGFAPTEARFKVYIVDEVHMLSTAAFNALLKTLEEPPGHAIFILATTEVHKIPETILSRCQRHDFRRQGVAVTAAKLERICAAEGVAADAAALEMVARAATGSLRDAESLLDQLVATGETITVEAVQAALGVPTGDVVAGVVDAAIDGDGGAGLRLINAAVDRGADVRQLQSQLLGHLRGLLLIQTGVDADLLAVADDTLARMRGQAARLPTPALVAMIHRFNEARPAADRALPALPLELALMQTILGAGAEPGPGPGAAPTKPAAPTGTPAAPPVGAPRPGGSRAAAGSAPSGRLEGAATGSPSTAAASQDAPRQATIQDGATGTAASARPTPPAMIPGDAVGVGADGPAAAQARAGAAPTAAAGPEITLARVEACWGDLVAAVERRDLNASVMLKDARPVAADATSVTVGFHFDFHCRRMSAPERKSLVAAALEPLLGARPDIRCILVASPSEEQAARPRNKSDQAKADPVVRHAIDTLGARIAGVGPDAGA